MLGCQDSPNPGTADDVVQGEVCTQRKGRPGGCIARDLEWPEANTVVHSDVRAAGGRGGWWSQSLPSLQTGLGVPGWGRRAWTPALQLPTCVKVGPLGWV